MSTPAGFATATRRVFAAYLALQAVAGVVFWALMLGSATFRPLCELAHGRPEATDAFLVADALVIVGSASAAVGLWRGARWVLPVLGFTAGGVLYPTFFLLGWVLLTGEDAGCLAIMVPPAMLTSWITWQSWRAMR